MLSFPLRSSALAATLLLIACNPSPSEESASTEDELRLEQEVIDTSLVELRAGEGYIPGLDEVPVATNNECLGVKDSEGKIDDASLPKITVAGGAVSSSAAIVYSRESLSRELGASVSGTIPVLGGLTGAASLTGKVTFDNQSAVVLFQTAGTYESVLTAAKVPAFDVSRVATCGFGYVSRAQHRVAAALVVSVRSTASGSDVTSELSLAKGDIAQAKANLNNIVRKGQIEISVRFASDVIPDLPSSPFSDAAIMVGDSEEDKADAIDKIDSALGWLAEAQAALNTYLVELQTNPDSTPVAPAQHIQFRYYPGTPAPIRSAIEAASKNIHATRDNLAQAVSLVDAWDKFDNAAADDHGHEWNIAAHPRTSVDELVAEKTAMIDDNGKLTTHEDALSELWENCALVLRNDSSIATIPELTKALMTSCVAPPKLPVDAASETIAPLAVVSANETVTGHHWCPKGFRLPLAEEAPLFSAWSQDVHKDNADQGVWLQESTCTFGRSWLYNGKVDCSPTFGATHGVSLCISIAGGPMPKP